MEIIISSILEGFCIGSMIFMVACIAFVIGMITFQIGFISFRFGRYGWKGIKKSKGKQHG